MNQKWVLSSAIVNGVTINNNNNNVNNNWRTTVVNYMNEMASIEWTPSVSFKHWSYGLSGGNNMYWRAGTTYSGIPYTQKEKQI